MAFGLVILTLSLCHLGIILTAAEDRPLKEFCNIEMFEATCAPDEVIVMTKARFGQMRVGRCVEVDLGYIGCGADVLYIFDEHCSGKQSCSVLVGDKDMGARSTCMKGLMQFLEADYKCVQAHEFNQKRCHDVPGLTLSSARELILSDNAIDSNCVHPNRPWKLNANNGQRLNVSLIDFNYDANTASNTIYGKLVDVQSAKEYKFGSHTRNQYLMTSVGRTIEVTIYSDSQRFALDVKVLGCQDMSPPDGAWMRRDGDVMEVGCHSGQKSWTLRCEDNHWVGAVGHCGSNTFNTVESGTQRSAGWSVSPNVVVFGVCSLILLVSSIVFLAGVLFLKKKPVKCRQDFGNAGTYPPTYDQNTIGHLKNVPNMSSSTIGTLAHPQVCTMPKSQATWMYENGSSDYKSLQANDRHQRRQDGDSVKYFVLEQNAIRQPMLAD